MRVKDLVRLGKRPWPQGLSSAGQSTATEDQSSCRTNNPSQLPMDDTQTPSTHAGIQKVNEAELSSPPSDIQNSRLLESREDAGQQFRLETLWAKAYQTVNDDPEYYHLLERFETYICNANGSSQGRLADASATSNGIKRLEEIQELTKTRLEKLPEGLTSFSICGKRIVIREILQKAIRIVKACKPIIGGAVASQPHAALAWAGILTILPMLENLYQQDEDAADGLSNILFILVRYQELQETVLSHESGRPSPTETTSQLLSNIESKLISVYTQIYVYEIRFILQFGREKWLRHLRNAITADDWKQMWKDIESTSRLVDQGIQDRIGARTLETWEQVNYIKDVTEEIRNLHKSTHETNLLLSLPFAETAPFDSAEVVSAETTCLEGTQRRILSDIRDWAESPSGEMIFWLHGMAGTGKTSIALTVAKALSQQKPFTKETDAPITAFLGASFFFKQSDASRNSTRVLFPTIARCLAEASPDFRSYMASAIDEKTAIGSKAPQQQLERLITRPLTFLDDQTFLPIRLIVVVDALDECAERSEAENLVSMLEGLKGLNQVQLRFLITSRSERHISRSFRSLPKELHRAMPLEKAKPHTEGDVTIDDIKLYLSHTLTEISKQHGIDEEWIDEATIERLNRRADGLFIYAATACRFLDAEDFYDDEARQERLDLILQDPSDNGSETNDSEIDDWEADGPQPRVDDIYLKVLSFPDRERTSPASRKRTYKSMHMTLGFLAIVFKPISTSSLRELLPSPFSDNLNELLTKLHAIVGVPQNDNSPLDLVHLSSRDFILNRKRSRHLKFHVDGGAMHREIFIRCLGIMSSQLRQDTCGLVTPGKPASEVPYSQIEENIANCLRYACRYWVGHLTKLDYILLKEVGLIDGGEVHLFLNKYVLYWLEAMSLMRETPAAILIINQLQDLVKHSEQPDLSSLLYDAKHFILSIRQVIDHTPLQIYASALLFSPQTSNIRSLFQSHIPRWVTQRPVVDQDWTSELSVLEGHTQSIHGLAFSPTDTLVVSISSDRTTRLWDYVTGTECSTFDEREYFYCVAFSPDGKLVALGSMSGFIRLREFGKGRVVDLEGHRTKVECVAFSRKNANIFASASYDSTVRIWNIDERQTKHVCSFPEGHRIGVVEFTPDGRFLMVGGLSENISVWDVENGQRLRTFEDRSLTRGHRIAISRNGDNIALIGDKSACLFDFSTGKKRFESSYDTYLTSILLVPPGEDVILLGTVNGNIEFRDFKTWSIVKRFYTSHNQSQFALSHDAELLVSASFHDHSLRLWDMRSNPMGSQVSEKTRNPANYVFLTSDCNVAVSRPYNYAGAQMWDVPNGSIKSMPIGFVVDIGFSPDGRYAVVVLEDKEGEKSFQLWNSSMTTQLLDFAQWGYITFSTDSSYIGLGLCEGGVRIVDSATFEEMMSFEGAKVFEIQFSPNSDIIGISTYDDESRKQTFELWNLPCKKQIWQTTAERYKSGDYPPSIEFSPNSQMVAFRSPESSYTHTLRDLATGSDTSVSTEVGLVFHPESDLIAIREKNYISYRRISIPIYEISSICQDLKYKLELHAQYGFQIYGPPGEPGDVCGMAVSTTGILAAVSQTRNGLGHNKAVQFWNFRTRVGIGSYSVEGEISNISFLDDEYLVCDQGRLPAPISLPDKEESSKNPHFSREGLYLGSQWVWHGFKKLLWIPPAYRSKTSVLKGETLALAHKSGDIRFVKFDLTLMP